MPLTSLTVAAGSVHVVWQLAAGAHRTWMHLTAPEQLPAWLGTTQAFEPKVRFRLGHRTTRQTTAGMVWRYDLDETDGGTSVRLTYDWTGTPPEHITRFGVPLADPTSLTLSLERLSRMVHGAGSRGGP